MPDDKFNFDDNGDSGFGGSEASLDDFFEPAASEPAKGKKGPSIDDFFAPPSPPSKPDLSFSDSQLPVKKGPVPDAALGPAPGLSDLSGPPLEDETLEGPSEKGFLTRNWLWLVIGVLVVIVGLGGTYLVMTMFFKPEPPPVAAVKPKPRPRPQKPEPPAPDNPQPEQPGAKPEVQPPETAPAVKPPEVTPPETKPEENKPATPPPAPVEPKPEKKHEPVASTGGPYKVQVGSYMLEASKVEPESILKELGYNDFHYAPEQQTLKMYHVMVGKDLTREQANEMMGRIEKLGYAPEMVPGAGGYRVKAYSYGSYSIAKSTRSKISGAGLGPVTIESETSQVTLDQLRVGSYKTKTEADKALRDLKRSGFPNAIIVKE